MFSKKNPAPVAVFQYSNKHACAQAGVRNAFRTQHARLEVRRYKSAVSEREEIPLGFCRNFKRASVQFVAALRPRDFLLLLFFERKKSKERICGKEKLEKYFATKNLPQRRFFETICPLPNPLPKGEEEVLKKTI